MSAEWQLISFVVALRCRRRLNPAIIRMVCAADSAFNQLLQRYYANWLTIYLMYTHIDMHDHSLTRATSAIFLLCCIFLFFSSFFSFLGRPRLCLRRVALRRPSYIDTAPSSVVTAGYVIGQQVAKQRTDATSKTSYLRSRTSFITAALL